MVHFHSMNKWIGSDGPYPLPTSTFSTLTSTRKPFAPVSKAARVRRYRSDRREPCVAHAPQCIQAESQRGPR